MGGLLSANVQADATIHSGAATATVAQGAATATVAQGAATATMETGAATVTMAPGAATATVASGAVNIESGGLLIAVVALAALLGPSAPRMVGLMACASCAAYRMFGMTTPKGAVPPTGQRVAISSLLPTSQEGAIVARLPWKSAVGRRHVVLIGNVGHGKSTVVEKVTGLTGLSSDANESFTLESQVFVTTCGRLSIADTPGANSMKDRFSHNVWIAHALNFAPVSLLLLTVKADTRMDNTVSAVVAYAECFQDFSHLLGICVSHMDEVSWTQQDFLLCTGTQLDIHTAVFVGLDTPGDIVLTDILQACKEPQDITVTSDNFLKFFKINNSNLKILKCIREEVAWFQTITRDFGDAMKGYNPKDQVDLVFEFQEYMSEQITAAQKRVSEKNGFTFMGDSMANDAGHVANLTHQLKGTLFDVRTMALGYTSQNTSSMRRCPHCGLVWARVEGCDGPTTCGNPVTDNPFDVRDSNFLTFGTFAFSWDGEKFSVSKKGVRAIGKRKRVDPNTKVIWQGCGKGISWKNMAEVDTPAEFSECNGVSTDDVEMIPAEVGPAWKQFFSNAISRIVVKVSRA